MPLYNFKCPGCDNRQRYMLSPEKVRAATPACPICYKSMVRAPAAPSTQVTETLDNGAMVRKLERPAEAEKIYDERARGKKGNI